MTPRPLYRWKSFWLGVLVIGFLCWAWWLSYGYQSYANYGRMVLAHGQGYVQVGRGWGGVATSAGHSPVAAGTYVFQFAPPPFLGRGEGQTPLAPMSTEKTTYQERLAWAYRNSSKGCWGMLIPHWLLMAGFAVVWGAMLGWRWWRMRNLTASHG